MVAVGLAAGLAAAGLELGPARIAEVRAVRTGALVVVVDAVVAGGELVAGRAGWLVPGRRAVAAGAGRVKLIVGLPGRAQLGRPQLRGEHAFGCG